MSDGTYTAPAHGWTCFHCGETFTTVGSARDHFGATPDATPGCMVKVALGGERGLLAALRKAEGELCLLHKKRAEEDTALHREMADMRARHRDALLDAEIAGYERGLAAARKPEPRAPKVCCVCGTTEGLHRDGWYGYRCSSVDCIVF